MQIMPLVSVIVPVYNTGKYLSKCLDSILQQTYKNLEVVVINDGSTDTSLQIAEQYAKEDARVCVLSQNNRGATYTRIRGIEEAKGEYIGFIDSDDWIEPRMYENLLNYMVNYHCDLVTSDIAKHELNGEVNVLADNYNKGLYIDLNRDVYPRMLYDFSIRWRALQCHLVTKLFRAGLLKSMIHSFDKRVVNGEDVMILYRYILKCHSVYISREQYYHYMANDNSATHCNSSWNATNLSILYENLKEAFETSSIRQQLMVQLKQYVLWMESVNLSVNYDIDLLGLSTWNFSYDQEIFNKRIVIYGAGNCGRGLYKEFARCGCLKNIVAWVDKNPDKVQLWAEQHPNEPMHKYAVHVKPINAIRDKIYDYIAVAIQREEIAREAINELNQLWGVPAEKTLWGKASKKNLRSMLEVAYL